MPIKNDRKSILENSSEDRLKNKLKENYKRFLKEEDEESSDFDLDADAPADEAEGEADLDLGGDAEAGADDLDLGSEEGADAEIGGEELADDSDILSDLTDEQGEQVDSWVDQLLQDSLDSVEVDDASALDTEMPADEIDPMGEEQTIHDGSPLTVDTLENVIDSDESLQALEQELATLAQDDSAIGTEDDDVIAGDELADDSLEGSDPLADDLEESEELEEKSRAWKKVKGENELAEGEENELNEWGKAEADEYEHESSKKEPFSEVEELDEAELAAAIKELGFDQGYEGEDTKDELAEDVELASGNKDLGFEETKEGLNDQITSTVSDGGVKGGAQTNVEEVNESIKKSKMLVKAAAVIAKLQEGAELSKAKIEALKLENYKLVKANALLSVAGENLSKEARTQISESFDACKTIDQVNAFYTKLTESIKKVQRPSLNEAVGATKTKIQRIKGSEAKSEATEKEVIKESVSQAQNRINYLMGLNDVKDAYFDF